MARNTVQTKTKSGFPLCERAPPDPAICYTKKNLLPCPYYLLNGLGMEFHGKPLAQPQDDGRVGQLVGFNVRHAFRVLPPRRALGKPKKWTWYNTPEVSHYVQGEKEFPNHDPGGHRGRDRPRLSSVPRRRKPKKAFPSRSSIPACTAWKVGSVPKDPGASPSRPDTGRPPRLRKNWRGCGSTPAPATAARPNGRRPSLSPKRRRRSWRKTARRSKYCRRRSRPTTGPTYSSPSMPTATPTLRSPATRRLRRGATTPGRPRPSPGSWTRSTASRPDFRRTRMSRGACADTTRSTGAATTTPSIP
jgi:hypothetical protein